ncbi:hypothetical protein MTO96_003615 [Rhipicephalus appendiculatus]
MFHVSVKHINVTLGNSSSWLLSAAWLRSDLTLSKANVNSSSRPGQTRPAKLRNRLVTNGGAERFRAVSRRVGEAKCRCASVTSRCMRSHVQLARVWAREAGATGG